MKEEELDFLFKISQCLNKLILKYDNLQRENKYLKDQLKIHDDFMQQQLKSSKDLVGEILTAAFNPKEIKNK